MFITVDPLETAEKRDLRSPKLKDEICCCTLIRPRASRFLAVLRCGRGIEFVFLLTFIGRDLRGADKSLARPGRKQPTATEDFEFHLSYL
jgi:hypothetical protein